MAKKPGPGARVAAVLKKDWDVNLDLDPVARDDPSIPAASAGAQNYLDSARTSVESTLSAASRQRAVRLSFEGKDLRGRYSEADQDLLRAALLFAGAGVDSALKRLLRDSLPEVVEVSEEAATRLARFAEDHIAPRNAAVDRTALAKLFLADRPRDALIDSYTDYLTGGSLQSAEKLREVALALGVEDRGFFKRIDPGKSLLRDMFTARNEIVHQLDLRDPGTQSRGAKAHKRETRTIGDVTKWATEALSACQFIVNSVAAQLEGGH